MLVKLDGIQINIELPEDIVTRIRELVTGLSQSPTTEKEEPIEDGFDEDESSFVPSTKISSYQTLLRTGFTDRVLTLIASNLLGFNIRSMHEVEKYLPKIQTRANEWMTRDLNISCWALLVKSCYLPDQRSPGTMIVGIDSENKLTSLQFKEGDPGSLRAWEGAFKDLKRRGLIGSPSVVLMPPEEVIRHAVDKVFPKAKKATCWTLTKGLALHYAKYGMRAELKSRLDDIKEARNKREFLSIVKKIRTDLKGIADPACDFLENEADYLFTYQSFPAGFHRVLRSLESLIKLERDLKSRVKGANTGNQYLDKTIMALTVLRMEYHWQKFPVDAEYLNARHSSRAKMEVIRS